MPVHVSLGFRKEGQLECSDGIPCCMYAGRVSLVAFRRSTW